MKPASFKAGMYIEYGIIEHKDKYPKFKVDDYVRISKCKNFFAKDYTPNQFEEVFLVKKVKNIAPLTKLLVISTVKKMLEHFIKKSCKRQTKKNSE